MQQYLCTQNNMQFAAAECENSRGHTHATHMIEQRSNFTFTPLFTDFISILALKT